LTVRLSDADFDRLFGDEMPTLLGTGMYANVYAVGDHALKITTDGSDVRALARAQGLPHVVRVHESWKLPGAVRPTRAPAWALRVERVAVATHEAFRAACEEREPFRERLKQAGVILGEFHAGNVGIDASGDWKMIDLGGSSLLGLIF
jgi:hypothetical protein